MNNYKPLQKWNLDRILKVIKIKNNKIQVLVQFDKNYFSN